LIALIGWKDPPYSHFCDWIGHYLGSQYTLLGRKSDPKHRSANTSTFSRYFSEIQDSIANSWRITPNVVSQFKYISNFKEIRHNMWIQVCKDPGKEWLKLRYYVIEEDVEMTMRD
jgi:hypothetical protein